MEQGKKIALVHLFSNGDCLYATAIARQIKHDYPGCHLSWFIAGFCKGLLNNNPYVDAVIETNSVSKNDIVAYRKLKQELKEQKRKGIFDEVFFTLNMDDNQKYYDGCIRTNILNAYPNKITEGIQPVLRLSAEEKLKVEQWVRAKNLSSFQHIVLFEFAPQSGQLNINTEMAISIAEKISANTNAAFILSSANKINSQNPAVLDGSELSFRESVYLSNFCTLMLGCSSGITWGTTSDGGKLLPMVQLLNPWTHWVNPISRDFDRQGLSTENVIELVNFNEELIISCINEIFINGFASSKRKYNQKIPLQFKTTRRIVYNLLCYFQLQAIITHISLNIKAFGWRAGLFKNVMLAIIGFPFKLVRNKLTK